MEEAQRYFFSSASHDLKTPIAATSVLLEGMIENLKHSLYTANQQLTNLAARRADRV
jgi:signal transduction histidine kinase